MDVAVCDLGGRTFHGPDEVLVEKGVGAWLLEVDLKSVEFRPPLLNVLAADLQ